MPQTKHTRFLLSIDCCIFQVFEETLELLLIERGNEPFRGSWALPGGFVECGESVEQAALRELEEETGVKNPHLEQCRVYSDPERDPRGHVVSVGFYALISEHKSELSPSEDAADAQWFPVSKLPKLAFDHKQIVRDAHKKLKEDLRRKPIVFQLLPKKFPLSQLQDIFEAVYLEKFDKRNFRKKLARAQIIKETGELQTGVSHRAAQLYTENRKLKTGEFFFQP